MIRGPGGTRIRPLLRSAFTGQSTESDPIPISEQTKIGQRGLNFRRLCVRRLRLLFCLVGYPVGFPSLSTIRRKRLLEVWRIRCDTRPDESGINRSALIDLLVIEFPSSVAKLPDHGIRLEDSIGRVGPVNAPLMGLRVVKTQRQTLDVGALVGALDIHFFYLRTAVQDLLTDRGPVEFHPFSGAD